MKEPEFRRILRPVGQLFLVSSPPAGGRPALDERIFSIILGQENVSIFFLCRSDEATSPTIEVASLPSQ
jgi:hypothetical protein